METLNPSNFDLIFDHRGYLDIFYTSRMIENQKNITTKEQNHKIKIQQKCHRIFIKYS